ncbi:hypothetical protein C461_08659 [Halorubrum aidingense JCM 13560]|uniref:Uncharacterized protein n=1 Tax=Halorubrum aidingense JCM 13560 TaxID=1230454 RepID=M0PG70_9EURY|nr:DUF6498-containing protein [Halorubrum aidingense]EMA67785.1 hypothetical protein C461_08659 [Halorubrum aidingense JCM 13560]
MPSTDHVPFLGALARGRRPRAFAVLVSNLLPLAGVVALGWNAAALVSLYWFELGIAAVWAVVRALFAGRPSEIEPETLLTGPLAARRAAVYVPGTDLRIRLSTLLVLPIVVPILAAVWLVAGAVTVGVAVDGGLDPAALDSVTLAALAIFATEGATTLVDYIYKGEYREHSAQTAVQGVFFRAGAVSVGGIFGVTLIAAATVGPDAELSAVDPGAVGLPLLIGIVGVKAAFDFAGLYRDRLAALDESSALELGWAYDPPADDPVTDSLPDAPRRVRPTRRGRLVGGLANAPRHPGLAYLGVLCLLAAGLFALSEQWILVGVLLTASVALPAFLLGLDYWLRYGAVEYRVGDGALVAYDRWFDTALWRVEAWDETDLRVERDRLDARLGTATVAIELRDRTVEVPRLADPDPVCSVFDRRAERPEE